MDLLIFEMNRFRDSKSILLHRAVTLAANAGAVELGVWQGPSALRYGNSIHVMITRLLPLKENQKRARLSRLVES